MRLAIGSLCVFIAIGATVAEEPAAGPPAINAADVQMLENLRDGLGPVVDAPNESGHPERDFRTHLQDAAKTAQVRQPRATTPAAATQPTTTHGRLTGSGEPALPPTDANTGWQALHSAAAQVDRAAAPLERRELWDSAEALRKLAAGLRSASQARQPQQAEEGSRQSPLSQPPYGMAGPAQAYGVAAPATARVVLPRWHDLLDAAERVDNAADKLERRRLWTHGQQLRDASVRLRSKARTLAQQADHHDA